MKKKLSIILTFLVIITISSSYISVAKTSLNYNENIFISLQDPPMPVRQPAEFEPMQGVLIRYPFGISYSIIAEMSEDVEVVTIVASSSEQSFVYNQYQSNGVNLDNCIFLIASSDSYWTRDYGPWFIFNGDDEQGIVDFTYNRPRPNDNLIPSKFGLEYSIPVYAMNIEHTGGNYMTDGQGISISTDLVWSENPGYTHSEIDQIMLDYCGIDTYHVVPDPNGEYIQHVDCWGKFLSPDTILIREVPSTHSQYDEIESTVDYFESQTNCYGTPYDIVRIYTPNNEPYSNSLILNNKVLVPITGSSWDDEAIDTYESAMPGYEVLGFTGSWQSTDALHCRAKGIVDREMLYIEHIPLLDQQYSSDGYEVNVKIFPYSGESLVNSDTKLYWKVENGSWNSEALNSLGNDDYSAVIPDVGGDVDVYYYIHANDYSNREENHPYIGELDPHVFSIIGGNQNNPPDKPEKPDGPTSGSPGSTYIYSTKTTDPNDDRVYYMWDWGDGTFSNWIGPFDSDNIASTNYNWTEEGTFMIRVKAKDTYGAESDWSDPLEVSMPKLKNQYPIFFNLLDRYFPYFSKIIKMIL